MVHPIRNFRRLTGKIKILHGTKQFSVLTAKILVLFALWAAVSLKKDFIPRLLQIVFVITRNVFLDTVRLTIPLASLATKISPRATQLEMELESRPEADPKLLQLEVNKLV